MTTTHASNSTTTTAGVLYLALDLGSGSWKLAFTVGLGQKPRVRTMHARDITKLLAEIRAAKARFGLAEDAPVVACYEAGRDGSWLHRCLRAQGIEIIVVDSASIEVSRRKRKSKSDRLDAIKLVEMLVRWHNGESKVWSVVCVPPAAAEDARHLHRELIALKGERTAHINAIKGILAGPGLVAVVTEKLPERLKGMRQWDGSPIPPGVHQRILRELQRWRLVCRQIAELEGQRRAKIRDDATPHVEKVRRLLGLKGIGENGAWLLVEELFGWRRIGNRRELGSLAGLAPTPYASGALRREQGISKAGNRRVRWMMAQLSWCWLRYQPESELSRWYMTRFAGGNARTRKVGIVALSRKLLVGLWKYLKDGTPPESAEVMDWKEKRSLAGGGPRARKAS
jgi:transposase